MTDVENTEYRIPIIVTAISGRPFILAYVHISRCQKEVCALTNDLALARLEAVQKELQSAGLDFIVIGPSADMAYLLGRALPATERFNALVIPRKGIPVIIMPALQRPLIGVTPFD